MRYVKYKTIISKQIDEDIDDLDVVRQILLALKEKELSCTVRLRAGININNVRILSVDDSKCLLRAVQNRSTLKKTALLSDIEYLELNTQTMEMMYTKPEVTRWMLLDSISENDDGRKANCGTGPM